MKTMKSPYFFLILSLLVFLTACASYADVPSHTPHAIPSATLLSPFILTPQHAQANAQSTIAAGQAVRSDLDITATALSLQGIQANQRATEVAIQITHAAATSDVFVQQTEIASQTTATAQAAIDRANAINMASTQFAAQTATTWPQTATPLAATQSAIVLETKNAERRAYWSQFVIPFWIFSGAVILVIVITGIVYAYRRLLRILEWRLSTVSSPDGETIMLLPAEEKIKALMPGRSFGAALHSGKDETTVSGIAPDLALQDRVVARNQAIRLTASLPPGRTPQQAQQLLNIGNSSEEKGKPVFRILAPTERPPLLDGDTLDILEGKWSETHDN